VQRYDTVYLADAAARNQLSKIGSLVCFLEKSTSVCNHRELLKSKK
jgi:hypothetical protein